MKPSIYITAWGETKSLLEWTQDPRCNVRSKMALMSRIRRLGLQGEEALTFTSKLRAPTPSFLITAYGVTKTWREWGMDPRCKRSIASLRGIVRRVNRQGKVETTNWEMVLKGKDHDNRKHDMITAWGETKSIWEWIDDERVTVFSVSDIRRRFEGARAKWHTPEELLTLEQLRCKQETRKKQGD